MKINQIFCKHIWETQTIRLVSQSIFYVVDTPISEKKYYLVESKCALCDKIKKEEQIKRRRFSTQETKDLMEQDKKEFNS